MRVLQLLDVQVMTTDTHETRAAGKTVGKAVYFYIIEYIR